MVTVRDSRREINANPPDFARKSNSEIKRELAAAASLHDYDGPKDGSHATLLRAAEKLIIRDHIDPAASARMLWEHRAWMDNPPTSAAVMDAVREVVQHNRKLDDYLHGRTDTGGPKPTASGNRQFKFIASDTFATGDYKPEWLVNGALVRGQPGVIAGPSKALKTSVSVDLAIAIASGTSFLGKWACPPIQRTFQVDGSTEIDLGSSRPARVAVVSGESGKATLQETAKRVCAEKSVDFAGLGDRLTWCFDLPTFSDAASMKSFGRELSRLDADVCIIDPVYLALGDIDARNLFEAGAAFRAVGEELLSAGCTPILVHHSKKMEPGEPMELAHLAYTGLEQFARQFILLNRREKFRGDGVHELWLTVGGSTGQGGLWSLKIDEGIIGDDFTGRRWRVLVESIDQSRESRTVQREKLAALKRRGRITVDGTAILDLIDKHAAKGEPGVTKSAIRTATGHSAQRLEEALTALVEDGHVEECKVEKHIGNNAKRSFSGYRRRSKVTSGTSGLLDVPD